MNHYNPDTKITDKDRFIQGVALESRQWEANLTSSDTQTRLNNCRYHAIRSFQNRATKTVNRKFPYELKLPIWRLLPTSMLAFAVFAFLILSNKVVLFNTQESLPLTHLMTAKMENAQTGQGCLL